MKTTPDDPARTRRRLISFVCAGVAFLVLAAIGVYGLVTGPNDDGTRPEAPAAPAPTDPTRPTPRLPYIAPSTDPDEFAREQVEEFIRVNARPGAPVPAAPVPVVNENR